MRKTSSRKWRSRRTRPARDRLVHVELERGDDAHVGAAHVGVAEPPVLAELEEAQQRRLDRPRHVGELVEEQRAAVRRLDEAGLRARAPR